MRSAHMSWEEGRGAAVLGGVQDRVISCVPHGCWEWGGLWEG